KEELVISIMNNHLKVRGSAARQYEGTNKKRIQQIRNFEAQKTREFIEKLTPFQYYQLLQSRNKSDIALGRKEKEIKGIDAEVWDNKSELEWQRQERLLSIRANEKFLPVTPDMGEDEYDSE